jgi:hypothetical protein
MICNFWCPLGRIATRRARYRAGLKSFVSRPSSRRLAAMTFEQGIAGPVCVPETPRAG